MRIERIGDGGDPADVLRALASLAVDRGAPAPAALIGDWFGSRAVLAPTVHTAPVGPASTFDLSDRETVGDTGPRGDDGPVIGGGWIGYLAYPDTPASGPPPRSQPRQAAGRTRYCGRTATAAGGTRA
ncbi:putative para-aminobenzoate synthase component I [Rhodococcus sp. MTM3W5.2]|nr:putative para-aminobenzoate synthase component I [Rhodococcus sp. MTM3W5.2]